MAAGEGAVPEVGEGLALEDGDQGGCEVPADDDGGHDPDGDAEVGVGVEKAVVEEEDGEFDGGHGDHVDDFAKVFGLLWRLSVF